MDKLSVSDQLEYIGYLREHVIIAGDGAARDRLAGEFKAIAGNENLHRDVRDRASEGLDALFAVKSSGKPGASAKSQAPQVTPVQAPGPVLVPGKAA